MREIEIKSAVKTCWKCHKCYAIGREACPMHEEAGIQPFGPPAIFLLAEGILYGDVKMSRELSLVPFSCTMCGACAKSCGSMFIHLPYEYPTKLIEGIRGMFVEAGAVPERVNEVFRDLATTKNAWRLPKSDRVVWEKECEIPIGDYARERSEFLLFVGDAPLIPETSHLPKVLAELLSKGGVDFGTLKEEEVDSGNEAREMGEEGLFEELALENIKNFNQFSVKKIIAISPHDYHALRSDYPSLGAEFEGIYHYTQIIADLIKGGKIKPTKEIPKTVTFQDPCHLGRYNDIYEAPRDIIKAIPGVKFVEMPRNHDEAFCCGAGGGRLWCEPEDGRGRQRISDMRVADAKEVNADIIATACPYCLSNFKGAGNLGDIFVKDIVELLLESIS